VSLAWKNLTHDRRKLALAIIGIAFAVMLMFQQRGFNNALFDSTVGLIREMDADILIINRARFALTSELRFERRILDDVASFRGVTSAYPVYLENTFALIRTSGRPARPIRVIAFDLSQPVVIDNRGDIRAALERLRKPNSAILDRLSKEYFGFDLNPERGFVQLGELSGKQIEIVGTFSLGRDFAHEGNVIMSLENFRKYFSYRGVNPTELVDLGIVRCTNRGEAASVRDELAARLPKDVRVFTKQQFIEREINFWSRSTPIGIIFAIGAVMGFVVGVIICYQILATDITDHYREFATLKAMGYGNWYFFQLVITQAFALGFLGFVPGLVLSWLLFRFNAAYTGLLMQITWDRAMFILVLTLIMCTLSGFFALRKLFRADPASLF
jgi:putative ABC transport system permease protein